MGCNAFAYCLNNPITFGDPNGTDAIVLLRNEREGELDVAHLGIMVQDEDGQWYHYFWGARRRWLVLSALKPNYYYPAIGTLVKYEGEITLEAINASGVYSGYDKMIYLTGDFSGTLDELPIAENGYPNGNYFEGYNLINNNCSQTSLGALANQDTPYQDALKNAFSRVLPESAFRVVEDDVMYKPCHSGGDAGKIQIRTVLLR